MPKSLKGSCKGSARVKLSSVPVLTWCRMLGNNLSHSWTAAGWTLEFFDFRNTTNDRGRPQADRYFAWWAWTMLGQGSSSEQIQCTRWKQRRKVSANTLDLFFMSERINWIVFIQNLPTRLTLRREENVLNERKVELHGRGHIGSVIGWALVIMRNGGTFDKI